MWTVTFGFIKHFASTTARDDSTSINHQYTAHLFYHSLNCVPLFQALKKHQQRAKFISAQYKQHKQAQQQSQQHKLSKKHHYDNYREYSADFARSQSITPPFPTAMSAPPQPLSSQNNNNNNNNDNDNINDSIPIHLSLPAEPLNQQGSNSRGYTGEYASDMSLASSLEGASQHQRYQQHQQQQHNSRYHGYNGKQNKVVAIVNRPQPLGASSSSSNSNINANDSNGDLNNQSNVRYNNMGNGIGTGGSGTGSGSGTPSSRRSPFFKSGNLNQSPISSILSSGSRILQQSMRAINVEPGSLRASTFTVITAMVGGGTLTIPYGLKLSLHFLNQWLLLE